MKWLLAISIALFACQLQAQQTFRVGGEIMNADTFEVRVYAHPQGLVYTQRCADKVWSVLLGDSDNYLIEFEHGKRIKVANLIGFKGETFDLTLDVDFANQTDIVVIKPSARRKPEITYRGQQFMFKRF